MEILHLTAHATVELWIPDEELARLPKKVGIITTVQHLKKIDMLKEQLPDAVIGGQLLGCNISNAQKISDAVDAFLFVGSGTFHALEVKRITGKDVYCYDPFTQTMELLSHQAYQKDLKRKRASYTRFLSADTIGILISTKPGQNNSKDALYLYDHLVSESDKRCYLFIGDMLTPAEAENYPFIDCFVNTACPRIVEDQFLRPIINYSDLVGFGYIAPRNAATQKESRGLASKED